MPLPSGTVALLFTDVEGSMELARTLGDGYGAVLADHRTLVREAVGRFGGREIDCRADEFFVVFERTADAVSAAAELQRSLAAHAWPEGGELRVRAAVHAGEPILAEDEYVGIDVHRVARICAAGHGGQVLLSQAAHGLVRDADPSWSFAELGEIELVGLPRPEPVVQLVADGLVADFPPLRVTAPQAEAEVELPEGALRVAIAEDSVLLREGVASLLESAGFRVVGQSGTAEDLLVKVRSYAPDVAVVDIRMPPTHTDEGLRAAHEIRERHPEVGVLILSQHVETGYAIDLLADNAEGIGYLLKDRVHDVDEFVDAVRRVATGGTAFDPQVVSTLLGRSAGRGSLDALTERERAVLGLMAEGLSNGAIAKRLYLSLRAVERHVGAIFDKLGLPAESESHRRVLAVLAFLQG
jgi:DNA-binding NarL/FixJ family response regulator/class 3 adenylate cyclase